MNKKQIVFITICSSIATAIVLFGFGMGLFWGARTMEQYGELHKKNEQIVEMSKRIDITNQNLVVLKQELERIDNEQVALIVAKYFR